MRFGVPLLGRRVAPRCTIADSLLLITAKRRRILEESVVPLESATWMELLCLLGDNDVDTLVCGGISRSSRDSLQSRAMDVIDNVAATAEEVVDALRQGRLRPGFGLAAEEPPPPPVGGREEPGSKADDAAVSREARGPALARTDCLACPDRVCLHAEPCPHVVLPPLEHGPDCAQMLEAAWDVASEEERTLCRLAEVVYFAMEMGYTRLGVAFCMDLLEPAAVLTRVLRRFFEVVPVCCKVRGIPREESLPPERAADPSSHDSGATTCDPVSQAAVLNAAHTDLNLLVGLCVGVDGIVSRESHAPTTTVFVKDKSLANNPIGAVYSHYHLEDI